MKRLLPFLFGILAASLLLPLLLQRLIIATSEPVRCDGGEERHTCGDCGAELQLVRPGKYQCVRCEWTDEQIERVLRNCG